MKRFALLPAILVLAMAGSSASLGADAPTTVPTTVPIGADAPLALLQRFGDSVDAGKADDAAACIDTSTDTGKAYSEFIHGVALARKIRVEIVKTITDKYGQETLTKAYDAMDRSNGALGMPYAIGKDFKADDAKEGYHFSPPGFMGEAVLKQKDGNWILDAGKVLDGVDRAVLKTELDNYTHQLQGFRDAVVASTSADDLITRLKAVP